MRDKRPVDELSIEELERILATRKREARQARLRGYQGSGRIIAPKLDLDQTPPVVEPTIAPPEAPKVASSAAAQKAPQAAAPAVPPVPPQPVALPDTYYENEPRFEDELDRSRQPFVQPVNKRVFRARIWNRALMFIEIAAVLGIAVVFIGLYQSLQSVTQVSADMQAQFEATSNARLVPPTPTPVINVNNVVLPVGHTISLDSNGVVSASFNLDEVPAQYRNQYMALMTQPQIEPTSSPQGPIRIQIPAIKVDSPVVEGDNWASLQLGVGHHMGSANPGERGNMVLSGHDDVYGEIFKSIDKLKPGDQVTVISTVKTYSYVVQSFQIVSPTDVWVLDSRGDQKQLTLITCYPYRVDSRRIVVFATLQS